MELDLGGVCHCQGHWEFWITKLSFVWSMPAVVSLSVLTLGIFILFKVTQTCQMECLEGRDQLSEQEESWMTLFFVVPKV